MPGRADVDHPRAFRPPWSTVFTPSSARQRSMPTCAPIARRLLRVEQRRPLRRRAAVKLEQLHFGIPDVLQHLRTSPAGRRRPCRGACTAGCRCSGAAPGAPARAAAARAPRPSGPPARPSLPLQPVAAAPMNLRLLSPLSRCIPHLLESERLRGRPPHRCSAPTLRPAPTAHNAGGAIDLPVPRPEGLRANRRDGAGNYGAVCGRRRMARGRSRTRVRGTGSSSCGPPSVDRETSHAQALQPHHRRVRVSPLGCSSPAPSPSSAAATPRTWCTTSSCPSRSSSPRRARSCRRT